MQVNDLVNEEKRHCNANNDLHRILQKFTLHLTFSIKPSSKFFFYNLLKCFNEYHIEMEGGHYSGFPLCGEFALIVKRVLVSCSLETVSDFLQKFFFPALR